MNKKQRSCDRRGGGGGIAQRPMAVNEHKKMGRCGARARMRGQNPQVLHILLSCKEEAILSLGKKIKLSKLK